MSRNVDRVQTLIDNVGVSETMQDNCLIFFLANKDMMYVIVCNQRRRKALSTDIKHPGTVLATTLALDGPRLTIKHRRLGLLDGLRYFSAFVSVSQHTRLPFVSSFIRSTGSDGSDVNSL